jgi:hypothetical protein
MVNRTDGSGDGCFWRASTFTAETVFNERHVRVYGGDVDGSGCIGDDDLKVCAYSF